METTYYHLDARRLTVYGMASGGAAPQPRPCLCLGRRERQPAPAGVVLNMADYRRSAAAALPERAPEAPVRPSPHRAPRRNARRAGLALEVCASLAIVVMAVVVVACFLPLL